MAKSGDRNPAGNSQGIGTGNDGDLRADKLRRISRFFPIKSTEGVVELFREEICGRGGDLWDGPDLAMLSIILGAVENGLTFETPLPGNAVKMTPIKGSSSAEGVESVSSLQRSSKSAKTPATSTTLTETGVFQPIYWPMIEGLYTKFSELLSVVSKAVKEIQTEKSHETVTFGRAQGTSSGGDERRKFLDKDETSAKKKGVIKAKQREIEISDCSTEANTRGCGTREPTVTSREMVKRVSDVIWSSLCSSYYKDRAHIQSLYSLLAGYKLDCFGVAICVVAACQQLSMTDVHLALSEDHAWVVFGVDGSETAEVTWHGKGVEDKRGESVSSKVKAGGWLYLRGHAVICTRGMEVAAMVSSINPMINAVTDSAELCQLQQVYPTGTNFAVLFIRYPMALCNIADLEELNPTARRPSPLYLFLSAVDAARSYYNNMHVYPHTYIGGYFYRQAQYKDALKAWANAAQVISKYNYQRDDQEVYKEFLQIANEIIPHIIRLVASDDANSFSSHSSALLPSASLPFLQDPECCALLFKFYDGICEWEEESCMPVLHITWATHMIGSISRFDPLARESITLLDYVPPESTATIVKKNEDSKRDNSLDSESSMRRAIPDDRQVIDFSKASYLINQTKKDDTLGDITEKDCNGNLGKQTSMKVTEQVSGAGLSKGVTAVIGIEGEAGVAQDEERIKSQIQELESKFGIVGESSDSGVSDVGKVESRAGGAMSDPKITELAHACAESLLNPEYLLGTAGEPFAAVNPASSAVGGNIEVAGTSTLQASNTSSGRQTRTMDDVAVRSNKTSYQLLSSVDGALNRHDALASIDEGSEAAHTAARQVTRNAIRVTLYLRSVKMKEIKDLLVARKLNANAVKLQLTAQSQVHRGQASVRYHHYSAFLRAESTARRLVKSAVQKRAKESLTCDGKEKKRARYSK